MKPENILVFNCGSSSLSFKVFKRLARKGRICPFYSGKAHRVGVKGSEPSFMETLYRGHKSRRETVLDSHRKAAALVLRDIAKKNITIDCVGHRFVHGGDYFKKASILNRENKRLLSLCLPLAPIHNPDSFSVIEESEEFLPRAVQYVSFDTAFHSTMPRRAYAYLLPEKIIENFGFRKYGFHGLSYSDVMSKTLEFLKNPLENLRIVACHLGTGGSSVTAVKNGKSIDTSMGYSPLPGLIMGTRTGDLDPMLILYLMSAYGYNPVELENVLNKKSGLLGISGFSSDIRDIIKKGKDDGTLPLAFSMYIHRLKKYIGSYIGVMGGIDILIFTDDIGVRSPLVREKVCENMQWCDLIIDRGKNSKADPETISSLETEKSRVKILSIPNDEEIVICREGISLMERL